MIGRWVAPGRGAPSEQADEGACRGESVLLDWSVRCTRRVDGCNPKACVRSCVLTGVRLHPVVLCVLCALRCVLTYQSSFWTRVPGCFTVRKSVEAAEQAGVSALCLRPCVATQEGGGETHGTGALGTAGGERAGRNTAVRRKGLRGVT